MFSKFSTDDVTESENRAWENNFYISFTIFLE